MSESDNLYQKRTKRNHFFLKDEGQLNIKNLTVGIAGLGGMGSNIAEYLVRLGVQNIRIADPDIIETSNINRQVIANLNSVGMKKAAASKRELLQISPDLNLSVYDDGITEENVDQFVSGCDVIVDEIDVFPIQAHYLLHQSARRYELPVYSAYVIGLGIHFYKFDGNEYRFEDFLSLKESMTPEEKFDEMVKSFIHESPSYLQDKNMEDFRSECLNDGVPIFGPSCLVGHSIVVTRILCDILGSKILGTPITPTPVMPEYLKIDFTTLETKIINAKK